MRTGWRATRAAAGTLVSPQHAQAKPCCGQQKTTGPNCHRGSNVMEGRAVTVGNSRRGAPRRVYLQGPSSLVHLLPRWEDYIVAPAATLPTRFATRNCFPGPSSDAGENIDTQADGRAADRSTTRSQPGLLLGSNAPPHYPRWYINGPKELRAEPLQFRHSPGLGSYHLGKDQAHTLRGRSSKGLTCQRPRRRC
jgi:hypothetical protein